MRLCFVLVAAVLSASCLGRSHTQNDGTYAFTFTTGDVIRDSCGELAKRPASGTTSALWNGELIVLGDTVRLRYELFDVQLVGSYLSGVERFTVDGSTNNVSTSANGVPECLLDIVNVHLEANTVSEDEFTGVLSVRYDARSPAACSCEFLVNYRAQRQP